MFEWHKSSSVNDAIVPLQCNYCISTSMCGSNEGLFVKNNNNNGTELNININIQMHYKYSIENTLSLKNINKSRILLKSRDFKSFLKNKLVKYKSI